MQMDAFVDRALAFLQGGAAQVRTAAAEAVIALLRHCPHEDQRTHIYHELLQNCAADAFASHRLMFLEACIHAAACFSHRCALFSQQFHLFVAPVTGATTTGNLLVLLCAVAQR